MKKGFTLIEMILSLAILAIILGISAPFLINFSTSQELDSVTEEMVSILRKAQEKSIIAENDSFWGIDFSQPHKYVLFRDNPLGPPLDTEIYEIPRNISLAVNYNLLKFEKLKGGISREFEAFLTSGSKKYKIYINQEGTIDYYRP